MSEITPEPVCAKEALELLNCVASASYDSDRCAALLESLRQCVLKKASELVAKYTQQASAGRISKFVKDMNVKKFSLSDPNPPPSISNEKKTRP